MSDMNAAEENGELHGAAGQSEQAIGATTINEILPYCIPEYHLPTDQCIHHTTCLSACQLLLAHVQSRLLIASLPPPEGCKVL